MPGKVNRIAVGERNKVYVIALDKQGMFTGATQAHAVNKDNVHALAYSKKHDRLYVAVSALPEEAAQ